MSASLTNLFSQWEQLNGLSLLWAGSCLLNLVIEWISLHKRQLIGLLLECTLHVLLECSVHVYSILIHLSSSEVEGSSRPWLLSHPSWKPLFMTSAEPTSLLTHQGSPDGYSLPGLTIISRLRNIQKILLENGLDYGEYKISEQQKDHKHCRPLLFPINILPIIPYMHKWTNSGNYRWNM